MMTKLKLRGISKNFGRGAVVRDLDLDVADGEFVALLGPSGCGKSTTLSIIAGFEQPDAGELQLDGKTITASAPQQRNIGLVFQDYALFTRMTVRENLEFGLKVRRFGSSERRRRLGEFVERMGLGDILERRSSSLNMSEMQKVALARALIVGPSVILLDEPMSNLDSAVRARLRSELKLIQKEFRQTILYVTHDQIEAMTMADRIAVMRGGVIEQIGTPREIYNDPRNRFVAEFIGEPAINLINGHIDEAGNLSTEPHGLMKSGQNWPYSGDLLLGIRPFDVIAKQTADATTVPATITDIENLGAEQVVHFAYGRQLICAVVPRRFSRVGETLHVAFDLANVHAIDPANGRVVGNGKEARAHRCGFEAQQ